MCVRDGYTQKLECLNCYFEFKVKDCVYYTVNCPRCLNVIGTEGYGMAEMVTTNPRTSLIECQGILERLGVFRKE